MGVSLGMWKRGASPEALGEIAELWNRNAVRRHAFYPWTGTSLAGMLSYKNQLDGRLIEARIDDRLVGFCHVAVADEDGYPRAGVVEAMLVDAASRGAGIGAALLKGAMTVLDNHRPRPMLVDALGAWPFGYLYNALADGSERSGVFLSEPELYRLFRRAGFEPVRKSLVMRANVRDPLAEPRPLPGETGFHVGKRGDQTWLDRVFRGRELWDHDLVRSDRRVLSRAIFGLMEPESRQEGKTIFSLFGVNTPNNFRAKGYAGVNLSHMFRRLAELGGDLVELHVYADNAPALALYRGLGFRPVAETMMMHCRL